MADIFKMAFVFLLLYDNMVCDRCYRSIVLILTKLQDFTFLSRNLYG
jgi:hypothetical protein